VGHGKLWKSNKLSENEQLKKKSNVEKTTDKSENQLIPVGKKTLARILCVIMWENTLNNRLF